MFTYIRRKKYKKR